MDVLITGGAGYIGSTVASACLDRGLTPIIIDDFSRGRRDFVTGRTTYEGDVADRALLDEVVRAHPRMRTVIHCAAKTRVEDSSRAPLHYYWHNVCKTIEMVRHLRRHGRFDVIFSSSASVYGSTTDQVVDESSPVSPASPYARTKLAAEMALEDAAAAGEIRVVALRYFNPIGADPHLRSGDHADEPSHVLGRLIHAYANGGRFLIRGVDWPTVDGSAVRDYIHVWDLARAHVDAVLRLETVLSASKNSYEVVNLGTGTGTTVRQLVEIFRGVVDGPLAVEETSRRPGDVAGCYTKTAKAAEMLGWRTELSHEAAVQDALRWWRHRRRGASAGARPSLGGSPLL